MKGITGSGQSLCKGPGVGWCLVCWRDIEEAHVAEAECVNRRKGGHEVREGPGQVVQGFVGRRGLLPLREVGVLRGCGQHRGDLDFEWIILNSFLSGEK